MVKKWLSLGMCLTAFFYNSAFLCAQTQAERIRVQPESLELSGAGGSHGLLVTVTTAEGQELDVTSAAKYRSENPEIVQVSDTGICRARVDGTSQIMVDYQGHSVSVPVTAKNCVKVEPPSFLNEVIPVLTRVGCNQGACHGKNSGQNGFRLSLRGYAPEWDYEWLTRDMTGRRLNPTIPEAGLILQKPLGVVPHEGGKLFSRESRAYQTLLSWLQADCPGPQTDERTLEKLEILPGDRTLKVGQEQQLLVRAKYSDGQWKDVTWLAKFASNDESVAQVDEFGKVRIHRPGETAVRAMFQGRVAVILFTAPYEQTIPDSLYTHKNNFIDEHVFGKLQALRIEPADLCSDEEFIRRVYLDTIGVLPTPEEVQTFLEDTQPNKRSRLIDSLLERPEFVDFWTLKLADLLQNRKESDHDVRGTKGVRSFHQWLRKQVADNRPWDQLTREVLTVKGDTSTHPAVGYYIVTVGENRRAHESEVVASVAQTFLGTRIGCAKCHNHPLEKYTQDDYYHFAGYFSRIKFQRQKPDKGPTTLLVSAWNERDNKKPVGVRQPRTNEFLVPQPLDRSTTPVQPDEDPREALVEWITAEDNDYFSGAMVNRLWAHFFKVGLVEPIDDLRASNPPSNPALWQALMREFVEHKYDLKHMIRLMVNSRTYQLSSKTKPTNERDQRFYSHYYARRLSAEVLLDALSQVTGVPERFPGYPLGIRAVQVPDPSVQSYFLSLFGRSERITACACESKGEVTLPQLLHLHCGDTIEQKLRSSQGRLAGWIQSKRSDEEIVRLIFLTALSRQPHPQEWTVLRQVLQEGDNRDVIFRDIFWSVLNSKEFAFNH